MSLHLALAMLLGFVLAGLADWLFAGVLIHRWYNAYPEVWRQGGERGRIIASQALAPLTAIGFVALAVKLGQVDGMGAAKLAGMIWLIGPLPIFLSNHFFLKLHPAVTAGLAAGWLAKLLLIAGATAWLL